MAYPFAFVMEAGEPFQLTRIRRLSLSAHTPLSVIARGKAVKTTNNGNILINIDLGSYQFISGISLVEHNLHTRTEITITGYSDAYSTEIISETCEAIGPIIGLGDVRLGQYSLGGWPTDEELLLLPKMVTSHWFDPTFARYWSIEIANGSGSTDTFYLGRIVLGDYWEVEVNPDWDLKYGRIDPSVKDGDTSVGQVEYSDEKSRYYQAEFTLSSLSDGELFNYFIKLCEYCGTRKSLILQIDDSTNKKQRFTTIYGKMSKSPMATMNFLDKNSATFIVKESL